MVPSASGMGVAVQKTNHLLFSLLVCHVQRSNRSSQSIPQPIQGNWLYCNTETWHCTARNCSTIF